MSNDVSEHLVRRFVLANSLSLSPKDAATTVRPWRPSTGSAADSFTAKNTVVFKDSDGKYRGGGIIEYNHLNPALLFKNITPVVYLYNPKSHAEIAEELGRRYGVPVFGVWVKNKAFDYTTLPQTVTIEFAANNYINEVSLNVRVERSNADLAEIFTKDVLATPNLPYEVLDARTNAAFSYHIDFTPDSLQEFKFLKAYPVDQITNENSYKNSQSVRVLRELVVERTNWTAQYETYYSPTPKSLCFKGSQLLYNGSTKRFVDPAADPASPTADAWYDNVLVIRFSSMYSGVQGLGYFHYNELS